MVINGTAQSSPEESYMQQLYLMMIKTVVTVCKTHYSTDHQNVLLSNYVKAAVLQAHKKCDISALIFMEYMKDVPYCTLNLVKLNRECITLIKVAKILIIIKTQGVRCVEL